MAPPITHTDVSPSRKIAEEARDHLLNEIVPFWFPQAVDRPRGGFYTCYDNRGRFVSDEKYTWSQGRFVAICAQLAQAARQGVLELDAETMIADARRGARFLRDHAVRSDLTTVYHLDGDGLPISSDGDSLYADCFAIIGFAGLATATGEAEWYELADRMVTAAWRTAAQAVVPTAPYQMPPRAEVLGVHMILLNVELDLAKARKAVGLPEDSTRLVRAVRGLSSMARPDGGFDEVHAEGYGPDTLLGSHRTPGHALEGLWMLAETDLPETPPVGQLVAWANGLCALGWDDEFGGLLRYVDGVRGGEPKGRRTGLAYEDLVSSTWDTKLWWVHSEGCWTSTLLAEMSGDPQLAEWRDRLWEYTTRVFPAGEDGREWIQIRDRRGDPLDKTVALPLKDPYHVTRNLLQLIRLAHPAGHGIAQETTP